MNFLRSFVVTQDNSEKIQVDPEEDSETISLDDPKNNGQYDDDILGECLSFSLAGKERNFSTNAKTILNNIPIWDLNRPIIESHIKSLLDGWERQYKRQKGIIVPGTIFIIDYGQGKKVFDGQHRLESLRRFFKKHQSYNVRVNVQLVQTSDNIEELVRWYEEINCLKPHNIKKELLSKKHELSLAIEEKYGHAVIRKDAGTVHRPRVTMRKLLLTLEYYDIIDKYDDVDDIMATLDKINEAFSEMSFEDIFGKEFESKAGKTKCINFWNKASSPEMGFYLALRVSKNEHLCWKGIDFEL